MKTLFFIFSLLFSVSLSAQCERLQHMSIEHDSKVVLHRCIQIEGALLRAKYHIIFSDMDQKLRDMLLTELYEISYFVGNRDYPFCIENDLMNPNFSD